MYERIRWPPPNVKYLLIQYFQIVRKGNVFNWLVATKLYDGWLLMVDGLSLTLYFEIYKYTNLGLL